jgi:hypothetical protein
MKHPSHRHGQSTSRITLLILSCAVFAFSIDAGAQGRVRTSKKVGGKSLAEDIKVVSDAQTRALALAEEMLKKKKTEEDKKSVQTVIDMIKKAQVFTEASSKDRSKLTDAVRAQELAFQALLELATREHNIKRQQSKSKGQPGKNRNQQQLNQLELKMKENKYETRRLASNEDQNQEQQEDLQALNRLRELARRQQDINERLKELQNALQAAKSNEEEKDVQRRLKRLMEEQARMMEDMDELDQRMQRPDNQQRMAESRKELQKTRENAQRSAKAMEKGEVSRALASGTRTQKQLEEMKEDFRKKNSNKFAEDLRQIRDATRELTDKQKELTERLAGKGDTKTPRKSLAGENKDAQTSTDLKDQTERLKEVMEHAEQVARQSEFAEPLLHKHLYDAVRNQTQREGRTVKETRDELVRQRVLTSSIVQMLRNAADTGETKSLDIASELSRIGFNKPASEISKSNQENLEDLERRVSRAAESVLGDETEALKQARREINDLTRQLAEELFRSNPNRFQTNQLARANTGAKGQKPGQQSKDGKGQGQPPGQQGKDGKGQGQPPGQQGKDGKGQGQPPGQQGKDGKGQGQPPGQQGKDGKGQGQQPGQQGKDGKGQGQQPGQQGKDGKGQGQQPGQQGKDGKGQGQQPGQQGKGGKGQGQGGQGEGQGQQRSLANNPPPNQQGRPGGRQGSRNSNSRGGGTGGNFGGWENILPPGMIPDRDGHNQGPLTGENFAEWSDRMRNVEEMVNTSELRNDLTKVRERVRAVRVDFKRHSKTPQWDLVETQIMKPLVEIRDRISEELARRNSREAMVPIDRDPVPNRFADVVRKYYESLGSSR